MAKRKPGTPYKSTTHRERFFHFPELRLTFFFREEPDVGWFYAYSRCSKKDQWCRSTGRAVARGFYFRKGNSSFGEEVNYNNVLRLASNVAAVHGN